MISSYSRKKKISYCNVIDFGNWMRFFSTDDTSICDEFPHIIVQQVELESKVIG